MIVTIVAVKESEGPVYLCGESTTYTTVAFGGYVEIALLSVPLRWARRLTVLYACYEVCCIFGPRLLQFVRKLSWQPTKYRRGREGDGRGREEKGGEGRPR